ncbi:Na(+)/H(+) antiporter subunit F1 [Paenibacillus sp. JMULE4]|uniref:Na(+)/H(+) antiporter subunit F1 n=1 Tax=Paenibacillus TaxID=44249 RepID=UPI0008818C1C|nr:MULTISPECIES: Na(+)/H(+) antiporter subunit F1 [Paenibacillus]NTZ19009.1 Na(+)/H(+) antiporter subunit F1 [Paenibacillus sp. JMULE4]SDI21981.1 multicomponent Na+:H+ antiporter subunit F [Paenibacillus naphthalenovorans]
MLSEMLFVALIILSLSILGCMYRVLKGPSMPDRIIALDSVGIQLIAIVAILSIMLRTQAYLEIILLIGILAFLGTIAFSKYIERGVVIEHERDHSNDR